MKGKFFQRTPWHARVFLRKNTFKFARKRPWEAIAGGAAIPPVGQPSFHGGVLRLPGSFCAIPSRFSVKISVKTAYACRVLAQIARLHGTGELAHVEALAKVEAVPPNYLAQILSELRDGGLITSRRGKTGGYALARSPEDISLYDIVTLVEGDVLEFGGDAKGQSGRRVAHAWRDIRTAMIEETKRYTLDMLVSREVEEMYYI